MNGSAQSTHLVNCVILTRHTACLAPPNVTILRSYFPTGHCWAMPTDPRPGGSSSFDEECLCLCPCRLPPHWDSLPDCCLPEQDRQPPSFWRRFCDQDIDEPGHGRLHRGRVKDSRWQLVLDDAGSVEGIYAFIYCTKWRFGQVLLMPYSLTYRLTDFER